MSNIFMILIIGVIAAVVVGVIVLVIILVNKNNKSNETKMVSQTVNDNNVGIIVCKKCGCPSSNSEEYCFECGNKLR